MSVTRRQVHDGFVLEHETGRLEVHELAPGVFLHEYFGSVIIEYFQPVTEAAEARISEGRRLVLIADISQYRSSTSEYRRKWTKWFEDHSDDIDAIITMIGSTLGRMAVNAANAVTGGMIRAFSDPDEFQAALEDAVMSAWSHEPEANSREVESERAGGVTPTLSPPTLTLDELAQLPTEEGPRQTLALPPSDEQDFMTPELSRFEMLHKLGQGGMGVVYACRDTHLDRDVAIKFLLGGTRTSLVRFIREAKMMAKVNHPNVIRIYDAQVSDGRAFIVMELVEGPTLGAWLRNSERSLADVLQQFLAAGWGLAAAHAEGMVHRDFKPDNVMIAKDGRVLVMDFGLARRDPSAGSEAPETGITAPGAMVGTPAYMAPEQLLCEATDARTDQYSFCVALWEALYGKRPYEGRSMADIYRAMTTKPLDRPRRGEVPYAIYRVIARGLAVEPSQRWESMPALLTALESTTTRPRRAWFSGWFARRSRGSQAPR